MIMAGRAGRRKTSRSRGIMWRQVIVWMFGICLFYVLGTVVVVNIFIFTKRVGLDDDRQKQLFAHTMTKDFLAANDVFHWNTILPNVTVFSAYYDDRNVLPSPQVTVLGFERQRDLSTPYYCFLVYKDKQFCERRNSTLFVLARDHQYAWRDNKVLSYRPFAFACPLPSSEIPERVAISSTTDCKNSENLLENTVLVVNRKGEEMKTFVVCICSPIYRVDDTEALVAAFEMNRLLGAEFFTVYAHNLPPKVLEILRKYSNDGLAEVVENWAVGMPKPVHYYGQLLSINDCLHKNIYRAKYLVYTDIDEVIMPLHHASWTALMQDIEKPEQGTFVFENTYLYSTQSIETIRRQCNGKDFSVSLTSPRYLNFRNRSRPISPSGITKYITKTAVTLVPQVHKVFILAPGYKMAQVPLNQALMYHYRIPYNKNKLEPINTRIPDNIMDRHQNKLLTAITNRLCAATAGRQNLPEYY